MKAYSPNEWGAAVDYDKWTDKFSPDDGVALHHGGGGNYPAANAPFTFEKEAAQLRSWERYHLNKGWRGLAYGWAVAQSGRIFRIRGWNTYGAHFGDIDGDGISNNAEIIPILWIASGNYHTMSVRAHDAIVWLRSEVIEVRSPKAKKLWGHKEIQLEKVTSCPGSGGMNYVNANRYLPTPEGDEMITKWLKESGFRKLYRLGVVQGVSEAQVVDYWITNRALRSDEEHASASSNVFVALAELAASRSDPAGQEALDALARIKSVI